MYYVNVCSVCLSTDEELDNTLERTSSASDIMLFLQDFYIMLISYATLDH